MRKGVKDSGKLEEKKESEREQESERRPSQKEINGLTQLERE